MKILGCSRSAQGARDSATLRGVLLTARKQGRNRIEASLQGPEELPGTLRDASRLRPPLLTPHPSPAADPASPARRLPPGLSTTATRPGFDRFPT